MFSVMRVVALAILLLMSSAAGQVTKDEETSRSTNQPTLTIKLDAQAQKPPATLVGEYVSVVTELLRAVAWPLIFGILVLTQRRPLARLLEALIELVRYSNRIKFGDMIDIEVDRSAKEAEESEVPMVEVPQKEIEAAARVGRMAESSDLSEIRGRMLEFASEYEATRSNMKPGPARTRAMNAIAAKMRTLAIAATPLLRELANDKNSAGKRLAALAILQLAPDLNYIDWVVERMSHEQPFLFFHASLVLLAMVRSYGTSARKELGAALKRSLDVVESFSGGPPDRNTIDALRLAQAELDKTPST